METVIDLSPIVQLTREQFHKLCEANPDLFLERTPDEELVLMAPVGGEGGNQEAELLGNLWLWNRQTRLGMVFSSSTLFGLPGGGDRGPDVAWIRQDRWEALTPDQRATFSLICPDFVTELRSRTDRLPPLQNKMQEYLRSGLQLGWLIDPIQKQVEIYRPAQCVETIPFPADLSGEDVLPGFQLRIER